MAEEVVDGLEAIEIQRQQRDLALRLCRHIDGKIEPLSKQRAVRKPGQRIMAGHMLDLALRQLLFRQITDGKDLARPATKFHRLHGKLENPVAIADQWGGLHRRLADILDTGAIGRRKHHARPLPDHVALGHVHEAGKLGIHLDDAALAHDGKAIQSRVDEPLEVGEVAIDRHRDHGQDDHRIGDDGNGADQPRLADATFGSRIEKRVRDQPGRGHGREMQRAGAKNGDHGRNGHALPAAKPLERIESSKIEREGDDCSDDDRLDDVGYIGRRLDGRHADEMHHRDRNHQHRTPRHIRADGANGEAGKRGEEPGNDDDGRKYSERHTEADGYRAFIGQHGHEMGGPYRQAADHRRRHDPHPSTADVAFMRPRQQEEKGEHARKRYTGSKEHGEVIVLLCDAFQDCKHACRLDVGVEVLGSINMHFH